MAPVGRGRGAKEQSAIPRQVGPQVGGEAQIRSELLTFVRFPDKRYCEVSGFRTDVMKCCTKYS